MTISTNGFSFTVHCLLSCSNPVVQVKAAESGALQTLLTLLATTRPLRVKKKVLIHTHITSYCVHKRTQLSSGALWCVTVSPPGSLCTGLPLAPLPLRTASLPVTWWAASPIRPVQGRWRWSSAYTHCYHVVWHDKWEGTKKKILTCIFNLLFCKMKKRLPKWWWWWWWWFPQELISQAGLDPALDGSHEERVRQYSKVSLQAELLEKGWCSLVPQLLESTEHDYREKVHWFYETVNRMFIMNRGSFNTKLAVLALKTD